MALTMTAAEMIALQRGNLAKMMLPAWFINATYVAAFLFCGFCSFNIVMYGMKFSPEETQSWLVSCGISMIQDIMIMEPGKCIARGALWTVLKYKTIVEFGGEEIVTF